MNINQLTSILIILLVTCKLLVMEETKNPLIWNGTQTQLQHHSESTTDDNERKTQKIIYKNASSYTFEDILTGRFKYMSPVIELNKSERLESRNSVKSEARTENSINNIYLTTQSPINVRKSNGRRQMNRNSRGRSIRMNKLRKLMRTFKETELKERAMNCGNDCNSIWNPMNNPNNIMPNDRRYPLVNQYLFPKPTEVVTEDPFLTRVRTYMNYQPNQYAQQTQLQDYETDNMFNKIYCNGTLIYANQSCFNFKNPIRRNDFISPRSIHESEFRYRQRKRIKNPFVHSRNRQSDDDDDNSNYDDSNDYQDSDDDRDYSQMPPPEDYKDEKAVSYQSSKIKNYPTVDTQQEAPEHAQYFDDTHDNHATHDNHDSHDNHELDDGYRWYPNSHHDDDYNKYHYNQDDVSKYEDKRALSRLQDMYYCSKYCHCCKKGGKRVTLKYNDFSPLGKLLSIMKYFGFNSGYNFFYGGRSSGRGIESYNPMAYFKNYYERFYGPLPSDKLIDDESFVFFNKDKGEPDTVSDCKEVCECCEENKKAKLKEQMKEIAKKEAKRKKKLEGLTGLIRYMIFSDDDGYYDFVDGDKTKGRSYSGNDFNLIGNPFSKRRVSYKYQDDDEDMTAPGGSTYDSDSPIEYPPSDDQLSYPDTPDHDHPIHDVHHDHDQHHVEEHHHPKYILFDCSKCCRFCKKTSPKTVRRQRKRKKKKDGLGLLDFLRSLLTGDAIGDNGGGGGTGSTAPTSTGSGTSPGSVSLSYAGGQDYFYDSIQSSGPSIPSAPSSSNMTCCFNSSSVNTLIVVVTIALIILNTFSSVNVVFIVIVPLIFFGMIIIFIFLLLQAITPVYFIPIFIIVLIIALIPILLLVVLFFLLLPIFLFPIFFPFVLKLSGHVPGANIASLNCARDNSSINCAIGSALNKSSAPMYADDTTNMVGFLNDTSFETTTDVSFVDYDSVAGTDIPLTREEKQLRIPDSLYWKINTALGKDHCLERAGCHLAIHTNSIRYYNKFILRILENLSLSINETKFTAYKEAYQIGSLNITNHEKCAKLYYCTKADKEHIKL